MSPRFRKPPAYRLHKPTGQAVVRIDGRDDYLGKHGTDTSEEAYRRLIAEWAACPRPSAGSSALPVLGVDLIINELLVAYWDEYVLVSYTKNGRSTSEVDNTRQALRFLRQLHGTLPARDFGPQALKLVRQAMIDAGRCRSLINKDVGRIRAMIRWGGEQELLSVIHTTSAAKLGTFESETRVAEWSFTSRSRAFEVRQDSLPGMLTRKPRASWYIWCGGPTFSTWPERSSGRSTSISRATQPTRSWCVNCTGWTTRASSATPTSSTSPHGVPAVGQVEFGDPGVAPAQAAPSQAPAVDAVEFASATAHTTIRRKLLAALAKFPAGETMSVIGKQAGLPNNKAKLGLAPLVADGLVISAKVTKTSGKGVREYQGYRLANTGPEHVPAAP